MTQAHLLPTEHEWKCPTCDEYTTEIELDDIVTCANCRKSFETTPAANNIIQAALLDMTHALGDEADLIARYPIIAAMHAYLERNYMSTTAMDSDWYPGKPPIRR